MLEQPPPVSPPVSAHAPPPAAIRAFGLDQARLGMDLAAFKSRPGVSCGPGQAAGVTVCRAPDQALGGGYFARNLTYRFAGGRLAQIRFQSSVDAFDWVTARLKKDDGQPSGIQRDTVSLRGGRVPHVLMSWKNGRATIALDDPVQPGTQLGVSITRDGAALPHVAQNRS